MSAVWIDRAIRALPAGVRASDGDAVRDLATEMIESGESSQFKEVRGILAYGIDKRMDGELDRFRGLPWASALWLLALPIASVQLAFLLSSPSHNFPGTFAQFREWPGFWWVGVIAFGVLSIAGAITRKRSVLGVGSAGMLAALIYDSYGPNGSMLHGVSRTHDFVIPAINTSIYSPVALVLIPTALLLVCAAIARPPVVARPGLSTRAIQAAWALLPVAGLIFTAAFPDLYGQNGPVGEAIDLVFFGALATMVWSGITAKRPERTLAAALLLISQSIVIALQFASPVMQLVAFPDSFQFAVGFTVIALAIGCALPFVVAWAIVRRSN